MIPAMEVLFPEESGPHPAVVLGAEAYGANNFIRGIQEKLVGLGYAVAVPDYYHGNGPSDPENYDDFTEVIGYIGRLDFTQGARDLAAAVHPVDLLWQLTCPALFLYGEHDKLMPPELLADVRDRIDEWGVDARINQYPGAGHSFTCPRGPMRNEAADRAAWNDAITFLSEKMGA
jgi:carboxymethylenebutenolidase